MLISPSNRATLTQVCVGENEVVLNLDNSASIMIASTVRIWGSGQDGTELQEAAQTGAALLPLLGKAIVTAVGDAGGWTTQ
jgi:hypothetical protein